MNMWKKLFNTYSQELELSMDKELIQKMECRYENKKILSDAYQLNKSIRYYPPNSEIDKHRLSIIKLFNGLEISFALSYPVKELENYSSYFFNKYDPDKIPDFSSDQCVFNPTEIYYIREPKCFIDNPYKTLKDIHKLACKTLYIFKLFDISETASNTDYKSISTRYYQKAIDELTKLTKEINKAKGRIKGAPDSKLYGKEAEVIRFMITESNSGIPFSRTDNCENTVLKKTAKRFNCSTRAILGLCGKKDLTEYKKMDANRLELYFKQIITLKLDFSLS